MIVDELKFHWQYDGKSVLCFVTAKDNSTIANSGAHAGKKDSFCRETGRRVSLERALQLASMRLFTTTAEQKKWRAKVWEVYRTGMTKRPRWKTPQDLQNFVNELRVTR